MMTINGLTPTQFEHVLKFFFQNDLPEDFVIKHDEKIQGQQSLVPRQIDVHAKGKIGVSEIIIAGEAKNWAEKVDVGVIDALNGKYGRKEDIPADKVLIFSNSGFTEGSMEKCKKLGFEMLQSTDSTKVIKTMPVVTAMAHIDQIQYEFFESSKQDFRMPQNFQEKMIILQGKEKISFMQNVHRQVAEELRRQKKSPVSVPEMLEIEQSNILFESKDEDGYKWNCNLIIRAKIGWLYDQRESEYADCFHVNSETNIKIPMESFVDAIKKTFTSGKRKILTPEEFKKLYETKGQEAIRMCHVYAIFDSENSKMELVGI